MKHAREFATEDGTGARLRLGTLLLRAQAVEQSDLDSALDAQARAAIPIGEILCRRGAVAAQDVARALAYQEGLYHVDLARYPADPALSAGYDPRTLVKEGAVPWRKLDGRVAWAVADPQAHLNREAPARGDDPLILTAERAAIEAEIQRYHGPELTEAARNRCPTPVSCRSWAKPNARRTRFGLAALAAFIWAAPMVVFSIVLMWAAALTAATTGLRLYALLSNFREDRTGEQAHLQSETVIAGPLPVISVIVPLYRETATVSQLLRALGRQSYPRELMDVLFVLETDDVRTPVELARIGLPPWARAICAPADALRTKPRAMNFALDFCRGSIVGIYDAEDRPEPAQLFRVAAAFAAAKPRVACLQGYLDFYNAGQNWLSRCFTIEYAIWFRVLLGGLARLGMPLPLGGTTVFFRRAALEAVGAWDAHNVTEDADLGMRLARHGFRTKMVRTTTYEEANCKVLPWIKQRGRWLKGYAATWRTHMQRPGALWHDLGPMGFLGFQVLLLGGLTAYLAMPLFWFLWGASLIGDGAIFTYGPPLVWQVFFASVLIGQAVMLAVAVRAVWPSPRRKLLLSLPLLPLYWPLGAMAAYRAIIDLVHRPFHWDKTEHGL